MIVGQTPDQYHDNELVIPTNRNYYIITSLNTRKELSRTYCCRVSCSCSNWRVSLVRLRMMPTVLLKHRPLLRVGSGIGRGCPSSCENCPGRSNPRCHLSVGDARPNPPLRFSKYHEYGEVTIKSIDAVAYLNPRVPKIQRRFGRFLSKELVDIKILKVIE
jgi:hypothetical protein